MRGGLAGATDTDTGKLSARSGQGREPKIYTTGASLSVVTSLLVVSHSDRLMFDKPTPCTICQQHQLPGDGRGHGKWDGRDDVRWTDLSCCCRLHFLGIVEQRPSGAARRRREAEQLAAGATRQVFACLGTGQSISARGI